MKREFAALVVGVGIFEGRRRVGVGDEYVLIRSVSGALPDELEAQTLLTVMGAMTTLSTAVLLVHAPKWHLHEQGMELVLR